MVKLRLREGQACASAAADRMLQMLTCSELQVEEIKEVMKWSSYCQVAGL